MCQFITRPFTLEECNSVPKHLHEERHRYGSAADCVNEKSGEGKRRMCDAAEEAPHVFALRRCWDNGPCPKCLEKALKAIPAEDVEDGIVAEDVDDGYCWVL